MVFGAKKKKPKLGLRSQAQQKFLKREKPKVLSQLQKERPSPQSLPQRIKQKPPAQKRPRKKVSPLERKSRSKLSGRSQYPLG